MRISDWSSDVCSSDLSPPKPLNSVSRKYRNSGTLFTRVQGQHGPVAMTSSCLAVNSPLHLYLARAATCHRPVAAKRCRWIDHSAPAQRSEDHTSELQSLMRISYAVFCLKKKNQQHSEHKY